MDGSLLKGIVNLNDKTKMLNRLSFSFEFNYLCWIVMKVDQQVYMNKSETIWQILPCHVKLKKQVCVGTQKLELRPVVCISPLFFLFFYPITCQLFEQTISKLFTCHVINMKSHLNVTLYSFCDQIYARHRSEVIKVFSENSNKWWWHRGPLSLAVSKTGTEVVTILNRKTTLQDRLRGG